MKRNEKGGDRAEQTGNVVSPAEKPGDKRRWSDRELEEATPYPLPEVPGDAEPEQPGPSDKP